MKLGALVLGLFLLLGTGGAALAVQPDEVLKDPAMEARARTLGRDLRCMVCQNQSIDDSDADLARDLRVLLRQRLVAGDTDEQAKQYLVDRYGDYVLLKPPFKTTTLVLWLGPGCLLLCGIWAAVMFYRRRSASGGPEGGQPLSEAERLRLKRLLSNDREG
ncbi:cytochrome c-type biogenesis protein CcmH [Telmatospirillum sp.]|uniref:cytochrome c-type biogenesis protein n=1 Tax=Telmatospirillum sp. TaxID=2079197 RepID=UPI002847C0E8|nr:cytochrome c-type biogenesis protein CcmH [Telmatospirillum sp.]MDR3440207.1 cytochrome c-type biogenesis protein CcmH [Telmatospirillum sp.]